MWGIQFRRSIRHKNEWTYWTPVPQNMQGPMALNRVSSFGTVVGLDLPPAGRNLEIKPYALGRRTTDRLQKPPVANDNNGEFGGDLKYGVDAAFGFYQNVAMTSRKFVSTPRPWAILISLSSAADGAKMMPPSTGAVALSMFTTSPQSTAA